MMPDLSGSPDILMVWPADRAPEVPAPPHGYSVGTLPTSHDAWWIDIHRQAVPSFSVARLKGWLDSYRSIALPNGILVATCDATGEPVATAGSLANSKSEMFPRGGQLGWVATAPSHAKKGLGTWLSALATARLVSEDFETIFLCTGDDLLQAISIYLTLGYLPYLYARDQEERWGRICAAIGRPHTPEQWPSPKDGASEG